MIIKFRFRPEDFVSRNSHKKDLFKIYSNFKKTYIRVEDSEHKEIRTLVKVVLKHKLIVKPTDILRSKFL